MRQIPHVSLMKLKSSQESPKMKIPEPLNQELLMTNLHGNAGEGILFATIEATLPDGTVIPSVADLRDAVAATDPTLASLNVTTIHDQVSTLMSHDDSSRRSLPSSRFSPCRSPASASTAS
jgi:hypothetical protein